MKNPRPVLFGTGGGLFQKISLGGKIRKISGALPSLRFSERIVIDALENVVHIYHHVLGEFF